MGYYIPSARVGNDFIKQVSGLDSEWLVQRTGIVTRSKIADDEDVVTMAIAAVSSAETGLPYSVSEVDLVISAGYTITDTVGTTAHRVQKHFEINEAKVVAVTSACSSFVNAVEIAEGYFASGKAKTVLIVCSEANSVYNDYSNPQSGHLWGDAAVAVFLSSERCKDSDAQIIDIATKGLAHIGKGADGVCLYPNKGGIVMHDGRGVFHYACTYMASITEELLERNNLSISDVSYFAFHQANLRILNNIAHQWKLPQERFFSNIRELGNTGSASAMLALAQNKEKVMCGDIVALSVFGGGYSCGGMIIRF